MEPNVSRSSKFVERWAQAEQSNLKFALALTGAVIVCLFLSTALVYLAVKPKPIYYIPGAFEAGVALPESVPQSTVKAFALSWVLDWTNFNPATVQSVYERAQRFMSPYLLAKTRSRLRQDIQDVKNNGISSLFSVSEEPILTSQKGGYAVTLQGDKGIYVGKDEIKIQPITYHILVRSISPTDNNPYGLMIEEIEQEGSS